MTGPSGALSRLRTRIRTRIGDRIRRTAPDPAQQQRLSALEAARHDQQQHIDRLEAELAAQRQRAEGLESARETQGQRVAALEGRMAAAATRLDQATLLVEQFRTMPYVSDALGLETFMDSRAGRVAGYRGQHQPIAPDDAYAYFSDVFRGDAARVGELQRPYLQLLAGHEPVLDVGCGRGELLDLLREAGIAYAGVDSDAGMVSHCLAAGHETVEHADAVSYLQRLGDAALGAIVSTQVVEHLDFADLWTLLVQARRTLRDGGLFIAETVNPHAPPSLRAFWVDPTHRHPLFPETLLALCRAVGFPSAFVFHPGGSGDVDADRHIQGAYAVVATMA